MRIVLVTHFYPAHGGGVEKVAEQLAAQMAADGAEVVWCASDTDTVAELARVRMVPMRALNVIERLTGFPYPIWGPRSVARLAKEIRDADAVHVHDCIYPASIAAAWLARRYGKRLVVTQHIGQVPLPLMLRPMLAAANRVGARSVLLRADAVCFISPAVRRYFESIAGQPCPNFHYVANGVDSRIFHPAEGSSLGCRAELGFDLALPLLLFVGRFVAKKRLHLVREMAIRRPDWQWCVIGHGPLDPRRWGLQNVRVLPPMGHRRLADHYRAADLLVLPSEGEGFPLVVQESMACGLPPCITAEVAAGGSLPRNLWLELRDTPGETAREGVEAIESWLGRSAGERREQREACAAYAAGEWQWERAARAHLSWMQRAGT